MKIKQSELNKIVDREVKKQIEEIMRLRDMNDDIREIRKMVWECRDEIDKLKHGKPNESNDTCCPAPTYIG